NESARSAGRLGGRLSPAVRRRKTRAAPYEVGVLSPPPRGGRKTHPGNAPGLFRERADPTASRETPHTLCQKQEIHHSYQHDRETRFSTKGMTRDHLDVLQNIEFALVTSAREDPAIDDRLVDRALRICKSGDEVTEDDDPRVENLCGLLMSMRAMREDV